MNLNLSSILSKYWEGVPVALWLTCCTETSYKARLNSSRAVMFTFSPMA